MILDARAVSGAAMALEEIDPHGSAWPADLTRMAVSF